MDRTDLLERARLYMERADAAMVHNNIERVKALSAIARNYMLMATHLPAPPDLETIRADAQIRSEEYLKSTKVAREAYIGQFKTNETTATELLYNLVISLMREYERYEREIAEGDPEWETYKSYLAAKKFIEETIGGEV